LNCSISIKEYIIIHGNCFELNTKSGILMDLNLVYTGIIILVALAFDYTNGMHDAANSISTIVSTRVLTPKQAIVWAAFFNFIAFLVFGTAVAKTIGSGMIDINTVTPTVILAGLCGAISWNMITWYFGLPSSSSHALIGGYAGAAVVNGGFGVIIAAGWYKTLIFIVAAPAIGMFLGFALRLLSTWLLYKQRPALIHKWSKWLQIVAAAAYSLGHGGNDAQKTMGIITSLLVAGGFLQTFEIPLWVVLSAQAAIALGTLSGGWRIVKTIGQKITKLEPIDGFCASTASAGSIFIATHMGIPVSTTHVITGAISGVGATRRLTAVRWGLTLRIVWAWLFTIPAAGAIGALFYYLVRLFL
jgi:PiT family inorganic phosphate transporter